MGVGWVVPSSQLKTDGNLSSQGGLSFLSAVPSCLGLSLAP